MNQQLYFVYMIELYIASFGRDACFACLYSISGNALVTCISSIQTKDYFYIPNI